MISIVTPTYNEKENITRFVKEVTSYISSLGERFELIIVDDNSPDGTADIVKSLRTKYPEVVLIKRVNKKGIGSAYFDGFVTAKGDIIIGLDADLSPSITTITTLIKKIKKGNDMVVGSRYLSASHIYGVSLSKRLGSRVFNMLLKYLLHIPISDITHSYRGFTKRTWQSIATHTFDAHHPSFFIELSFWTVKEGFKIDEIPITFVERTYGISKLNLLQGLRAACSTIIKLRKYE